jgi:uncharacterized protein (TIGR02569 family)
MDPRPDTQRPSDAILASFDAHGEPVPLVGGRGRAWRVDDIVLKPADLGPDEHAWQADVLPTIRQDGFRLALPKRARDGSLVIDGWAATEHVAGEHRPRRWLDIIDVGTRFARAVREIPRPAFLDARTDAWSLADRIAWGEADIEPYRRIPSVDRLADVVRPIDATDQLIHGDLTGNVLFSDGRPPAIIDLSPYWRPPAFASAVVVADALVWEGADRSLASAFEPAGLFGQFLARALLFRLVSAAIGRFEGDDVALEESYSPTVELLVDSIRATE